MATLTYDLTSAEWLSGNRYTASGETDIRLSNTGPNKLVWAMTDDDTAPAITPRRGHPIASGDYAAMIMPAGQRLWISARFDDEPTEASLEV